MTGAVADQPGRGGRSGSPAGRLGDEVAEVFRDELRVVRRELVEAAKPAGVGFAMLAAAGGCLVLGAGAASATMLRMLEAFLPKRLAVMGLTSGYIAAAVVLGRLGLAQLKAAGGTSAVIADEVRDAVSATADRVVPAATAAAREVLPGRGGATTPMD